jgi:hypothetical protein
MHTSCSLDRAATQTTRCDSGLVTSESWLLNAAVLQLGSCAVLQVQYLVDVDQLCLWQEPSAAAYMYGDVTRCGLI